MLRRLLPVVMAAAAVLPATAHADAPACKVPGQHVVFFYQQTEVLTDGAHYTACNLDSGRITKIAGGKKLVDPEFFAGRRWLGTHYGNRIEILNSRKGKLEATVKGIDQVFMSAYANLVYTTGDGLFFRTLTGGKVKQLSGDSGPFVVSDHGSQLTVYYGSGQFAKVYGGDVDFGNNPRPFKKSGRCARKGYTLGYAEGRARVLADSAGHVLLCDAETGHLTAADGGAKGVAFSPHHAFVNGQWLVESEGNQSKWAAYDLVTGDRREIGVEDEHNAFGPFEVAPNGTVIYGLEHSPSENDQIWAILADGTRTRLDDPNGGAVDRFSIAIDDTTVYWLRGDQVQTAPIP